MLDESNAVPTVYLETTIVSYLTSYPSTHIVVAANQEITRQWWERERSQYRCFVSPYVLKEASLGDQDAARKRMQVLSEISSLKLKPKIELLAARIIIA